MVLPSGPRNQAALHEVNQLLSGLQSLPTSILTYYCVSIGNHDFLMANHGSPFHNDGVNHDGSWLRNGYGSLMDGGAPSAALGFQLEPSLGARFFVKKSWPWHCQWQGWALQQFPHVSCPLLDDLDGDWGIPLRTNAQKKLKADVRIHGWLSELL